MRRIYESSAVRRDDSDPFSPTEASGGDQPQSSRWVPSTWLSRNLIPHWLRYRLLSVSIETPQTEFPYKSQVPFIFRIKNSAPFPITITTTSPIFWNWTVDGLVEASHVDGDQPAKERSTFTIGRGDRVTISRTWKGMFRVSDLEWEWAEPGEYTLAAAVNVENPEKKGLAAEETIRITPI